MKSDEINYVVIRADKAGMQIINRRLSRLGKSIGLRVDAGAFEEVRALVSERERELAAEVADLRKQLSLFTGIPNGAAVAGDQTGEHQNVQL